MRSHTRGIENALTALHQLSYVLEVGIDDPADNPIDLELVRSIAWTVQEQAEDLPGELDDLPGRLTDQPELQSAATEYADVAANAYRAFWHRINATAERLDNRGTRADAEVVAVVIPMLSAVSAAFQIEH